MHRIRRLKGIVSTVCCVVAAAVPSTACAQRTSRAEPTNRPVTARSDLTTEERSVTELFAAASPSVAYITSVALRRDFFRMNVMEIPSGTGSGIVWDDRGNVVTNFHVIEDADLAAANLEPRRIGWLEIAGQGAVALPVHADVEHGATFNTRFKAIDVFEERDRYRELASQTLEAYRNLNTVAAEASFGRNGSVDGAGLARASELLESVLAEIESMPTWLRYRFISRAKVRSLLPIREVKLHSVSNSGPSASKLSTT